MFGDKKMLATLSVTEPKKIAQVIHFDLGDHSKEVATLTAATGAYKIGEVLGVVTANGNHEKYDNASALGPEIAVAICLAKVDTTGGAVIGVPIEVRVATLLTEGLVFDAGQDQAAQDAAIVDLIAAGFKVQQGIG